MQNFNANVNLQMDGQTDEQTSDERHIFLGINAWGYSQSEF